MSVVFNAATAANVNILRTTNNLFQGTQKRVATGKMIFGADDDAPKYTMSETMLSRSRFLDAVNNNISTSLKALESTDRSLKQIKGLLDQMQDAATKALNAQGSMSISVTTNNNINESTAVNGASAGHRLSITSDNGRNFTYTFTGATNATTWGQVARALNDANIGVTLRFQPAGGVNTNIVLESTDGKTGFTVDGNSSSQVVDDLGASFSSAYDGPYNNSRFTNGTSMPTGFGGSNPMGLRFASGGMVQSASTFANSNVAAGSSITFQGADGIARTWSTRTDKTLDAVLGEINGLNAGVKAEFVQTGAGQNRISLRNLSGEAMIVLNGTGAFDSTNAAPGAAPPAPLAPGGAPTVGTGAARFNGPGSPTPVVQGNPLQVTPNTERRLEYGRVFETYKADVTGIITNNVTPAGRNLLRGENVAILLNEFSAEALTIRGVNTSINPRGNIDLSQAGSSWGSIANIQASKNQITAAVKTILDLQAQFGAMSSMVKDRLELNKVYSKDMETLGNDLVAAEVGEESAKLTALQTQQQFAVQAFSAGAQNAQGLLRLLG